MRGINTCLATFLERKTRKYLVYKIPKKDSKSMLKAMKQLVEYLLNAAVKSITCDRGTEFVHQQGVGLIEDTLGVKIYYAAPYASYQRGSNEYHNGLLREYHPKPSNFRKVPQRTISESVDSINTRSRKTLKWRSAQLNFEKECSKLR